LLEEFLATNEADLAALIADMLQETLGE